MSADADGVVKLWDVRMVAEVLTITCSKYPANKATFDASGLVSTYHGGALLQFDNSAVVPGLAMLLSARRFARGLPAACTDFVLCTGAGGGSCKW